jgi:hypothetical protein
VRHGLALSLALAAGAALSALAPAASAYRTGPPAAHTGGFGEGTCAVCHWQEQPVGRSLRVDVPARYERGAAYEVVVTLDDPALAVAGFQLSARFADGPAAGRQAGTLEPVDSTVLVVTSSADVEYAGHTLPGTAPDSTGLARWIVRWTAPEEGGEVVFHAAANAANDDASELGDRVHAAEARSR